MLLLLFPEPLDDAMSGIDSPDQAPGPISKVHVFHLFGILVVTDGEAIGGQKRRQFSRFDAEPPPLPGPRHSLSQPRFTVPRVLLAEDRCPHVVKDNPTS